MWKMALNAHDAVIIMRFISFVGYLFVCVRRLCFFKEMWSGQAHRACGMSVQLIFFYFFFCGMLGKVNEQTVEPKRKQFCFSSKWPNDILWSGWVFIYFFFYFPRLEREREWDGRDNKTELFSLSHFLAQRGLIPLAVRIDRLIFFLDQNYTPWFNSTGAKNWQPAHTSKCHNI